MAERTAEQKAAHAKRERERRARLRAEANPMGAAPKVRAEEEAKVAPKAKAAKATVAPGDGLRWPEGSKTCPTCKETKPKSDFASNRSSKDGAYHACKACGVISRKRQAEARKAKAAPVAEEGFNPVPEGMKATVVSAGRAS